MFPVFCLVVNMRQVNLSLQEQTSNSQSNLKVPNLLDTSKGFQSRVIILAEDEICVAALPL